MSVESSTESTGTGTERSDLEARIDELEAENERLKTVVGPRVTYRRAAVLLILIAAAAAGATTVYPESRDVLIGIAGTGAFGAVLLGTLVQERLVSASVGRAIYDVLWENEFRIANRLRIAETSRYVPTDEESLGVRLYLTRSFEDPLPPSESMDSTVVTVGDHYGMLLEPTGREFLAELVRTNGDLPGNVRVAQVLLREAIAQQFELADSVEVVDLAFPDEAGRNRMTVRVWGSVLGDAARLDHPIRSFIAVSLARIVGEPIEAEGTTEENGSALLTFRWDGEPPEPVE
jgi:hypothetical protein